MWSDFCFRKILLIAYTNNARRGYCTVPGERWWWFRQRATVKMVRNDCIHSGYNFLGEVRIAFADRVRIEGKREESEWPIQKWKSSEDLLRQTKSEGIVLSLLEDNFAGYGNSQVGRILFSALNISLTFSFLFAWFLRNQISFLSLYLLQVRCFFPSWLLLGIFFILDFLSFETNTAGCVLSAFILAWCCLSFLDV